MPGIICIVGCKRDELLDSMCKTIMYEDWNKVNKYCHDNFCIGRVHLGILNPEPQPIFNEDETLCIFMDGEIFDYDQDKERLKQKKHEFHVNNDPEFCLHLYEEHGEKFVEKLNGSFVISILDTKNNKLLIANDRFGLRPLYYAQADDKLLFASEVKAILKDETFKREINDDAVAEFFTFGQLLGSKTFFKGIDVLLPASIFTWTDGKISIRQYWDFEYAETAQNYSEEYYVEELIKLFKKAVERRLKGRHRLGLFLSGGADSRAVLAAIDRKYPVTAINFTFSGMDNTPDIVKNVAKIKGTDLRQFNIESDIFIEFAKKGVYLTDGMVPVLHIHELSLLDEFKDCADVILNGWEPETTFKGKFVDKRILSVKNDEELYKLLYDKYAVIDDKTVSSLFSEGYDCKVHEVSFQNLKKEIEKIKNTHPANKNDIFVFLNRELRSMQLGAVYKRIKFEDREPFRDNDLIDFALKIPLELRYKQHLYYKFLMKLSPELFNVEISPANSKINSCLYKVYSLKKAATRKIIDIVKIKSRGLIKVPVKDDYPDYGEWIRENKKLKMQVEDILLDERTLSRRYFNRDFIIRMVKDHMIYKKDYTQAIFILLTFELWYRMFIEGEGLA